MEEIIRESGTSRGSFYHYFEGKDALLSSLSYLFDRKYAELSPTLDPRQDRFDQLMYLNRELFILIENSISPDLLARLYSSQLVTRGEKHLLDYNRIYYKLLRTIMAQGQQRGELRDDLTVSELVRVYALCERALIYDWCLSGGGYSLPSTARPCCPCSSADSGPDRLRTLPRNVLSLPLDTQGFCGILQEWCIEFILYTILCSILPPSVL